MARSRLERPIRAAILVAPTLRVKHFGFLTVPFAPIYRVRRVR
jgi:hypothetical protein